MIELAADLGRFWTDIMKKLLKWLLFLVVTLAVIIFGVVLCCQDELTKAAIMQENRRISSGSFAGASIGDPRAQARRFFLSRGLSLSRVSRGGDCYGNRYPEEILLEVYIDDTWRNGSVCVASENGRIKELSWFYSFWSP